MTINNMRKELELRQDRWKELLGTDTYNGEILETDKIDTLVAVAEEDDEAFKILKRLEQTERDHRHRHLRYMGRAPYDELFHDTLGMVDVYRCNSCELADCEDEYCFYEDFYNRCGNLDRGVKVREPGENTLGKKHETPLDELWEHTLLEVIWGINEWGVEWYDDKVEEFYNEYEHRGEYTGSGLSLKLVEEDGEDKIWELRCEAETAPAVGDMFFVIAYEINNRTI